MNAFTDLFVIMRVAGDQRFVVRKGIAEKSLSRLLLLLILKSSKFHRKNTCVGAYCSDKVSEPRAHFS